MIFFYRIIRAIDIDFLKMNILSDIMKFIKWNELETKNTIVLYIYFQFFQINFFSQNIV